MSDATPKPGHISDETKAFLRSNVDSVGTLEILLLLHASPERGWTTQELNDELRSSLTSVESRVLRLVTKNLVSAQGIPNVYRYAPPAPKVAAVVDGLAVLYENFRLRVIDLLFTGTDQIQNFSDSFRIKENRDRHE